MPEYIDTIIMVIPAKKLDAYTKREKLSAKLHLKHGALDYRVSVGDDMNPTWATAFPELATSRSTDFVVITTVRYKSRKHRDGIQIKVMKDEESLKIDSASKIRFDTEPLIYGGFETLIK